MSKKLATRFLLFTLALSMLPACGKSRTLETDEAHGNQQPLALADNPNAVLSPAMQRLRGRWVKELDDPQQPNPTTMRMFATADNTLEGRMLFAGAFADTGVAATLKEEGGVFTLTLRDDDLRPHDWIPKERTLTGAYDTVKQTLSLKSKDGGENLDFEFQTILYSMKFSGNFFRCILVPTGDGGSGGGSSSGGSTPTDPLPLPVPGPSGGGGSGSGDRDRPLPDPRRRANPRYELMPSPTPTPTPIGTPVPTARLMSCGTGSTYQENWSRMSGSGL